MTTPSPGQQRTMSMSPSVDMSMGGPRHHPADVNFLQQQNGSLPMHMRVGSPVAGGSPVSAATAAVYASGAPAAMRPTSHPTGYGPPSTLEPNLEGQQQQQQGQHQPHSAGPTSSASGSPHMSAMGWQSPTHMASPTSQSGSTHGANGAPSGSASAAAAAAAGYMYADPGDGYGSAVNAAGQMGHMFYGAAQQQAHQGQMRRGQGPEGLIHM